MENSADPVLAFWTAVLQLLSTAWPTLIVLATSIVTLVINNRSNQRARKDDAELTLKRDAAAREEAARQHERELESARQAVSVEAALEALTLLRQASDEIQTADRDGGDAWERWHERWYSRLFQLRILADRSSDDSYRESAAGALALARRMNVPTANGKGPELQRLELLAEVFSAQARNSRLSARTGARIAEELAADDS